MIFHALFRLLEKNFEKSFKKIVKEILDVFYKHAIKIFEFDFINVIKIKVYYIILIKMSNDFKTWFYKIYDIDEQWKRILEILRKDLFSFTFQTTSKTSLNDELKKTRYTCQASQRPIVLFFWRRSRKTVHFSFNEKESFSHNV